MDSVCPLSSSGPAQVGNVTELANWADWGHCEWGAGVQSSKEVGTHLTEVMPGTNNLMHLKSCILRHLLKLVGGGCPMNVTKKNIIFEGVYED